VAACGRPRVTATERHTKAPEEFNRELASGASVYLAAFQLSVSY